MEAERKHIRESLNERRSELTKAEDKIYKACGTQPYDVTLSKYTTTVEKLQVLLHRLITINFLNY